MIPEIVGGSIELNFENNSLKFKSEDTIKLELKLKILREVRANELSVSFYGLRLESYGRTLYYKKVYEVKQVLESVKTYQPGVYTYNVELKVPVLKEPKLEGFDKIVYDMSKFFVPPIKWYVEAKLDIPLAFDINKKLELKLEGEPIYT
ncbi:MAG: hypothetical protein N3E37_00045 [Candidatus Micrarchaeota archaeon]|nr:hypothetical protein [Candidatus Micrarchaeota archaeon]